MENKGRENKMENKIRFKDKIALQHIHVIHCTFYQSRTRIDMS